MELEFPGFLYKDPSTIGKPNLVKSLGLVCHMKKDGNDDDRKCDDDGYYGRTLFFFPN